MDRKKLDYFTKLILREKERTIENISSYGRDFKYIEPKASEYGENASLGGRKEFLTNLADLESKEIKEANKALRRIFKGTYGICVRCGSEIPEERLEALPTTELCVSCKKLEEDRELARRERRSPWRTALAAEVPVNNTSWGEDENGFDLT